MGGHVFVELSKGVEHTDLDGKAFDAVVTAGKTHVADLTWKELALYNWGTAEPAEVNRILSETIGCETIDEKDPSKTKLAVKKGPKTTVAPRLPKLWTQGDLAPNKTHTIKVKKRVAAPAVAITELAAWFLPGAECALKYRLEGIEGRADKLDFEVHAHGYFAENKGGSPEPSDTTAEAGSTHIFQKLLTPDLKKRDAQEWSGWKGESQATKGVLASTGPYKHASHHCAPYTVLLRYRKSDADKAKLVLGPFAPAWKPAAAEPTDESLVVTWKLAGDDGRKLTRGLLLVVDKDGKEVFRAGLDRTALEGGKYDLAKDARNAWPKASVKKAELPYRVQLLAHSESDVEEGLALAAMHTLVRACNYTSVQFIGCNIRPGYTDKTPKEYLGEDDADDDIKKRADVMIEAIKLAAKDAKTKKDDASVLKVFMAPEFYWRGTAGAYPAEKLDSIVDVLRPEVAKPEYADWLFVYGTAIGYLPNEEVDDKGAPTGTAKTFATVDHPGLVPYPGTITKVTTTEVTRVEIDSKDLPAIGLVGATLENGAATLEDEVTASRLVGGTIHELTLKGTTAFENGPAKVTELRSTVTDVVAGPPTKLTVRSPLCRRGGMRNEEAWKVKQGSTEAIVQSRTWLDGDRSELTLDKQAAFTKGAIDFIYVPALVTAVSSATSLRVRSRMCSRVPDIVPSGGKAIRWTVKQTGKTAEVDKCELKGSADYELTLKAPGAVFTAGEPLELVEPKTTEVLNVALVQKGWPAPLAPGQLRQVVVYKENVSHIDYLDPATARTVDFYDKSGVGRSVKIHGNDDRTIVPTWGANDILGASPNLTTSTSTYQDPHGNKHVVGSEINTTGMGGGGVFTLDGVTFGLEVCRDHLVGKLKKFYPNAKKDDPRVQVLLVPSWGAWIKADSLECEPNAPVLNVDGGRSDSVVRVNDGTTWSCEGEHPDVSKAGAGTCGAELTHFLCQTCKKHVGTSKHSARCPTHGQGALVEHRECGGLYTSWWCGTCADIKATNVNCGHGPRAELRACNYQTPVWYCTECPGAALAKCTTHPTKVFEVRGCATCNKIYDIGKDCPSNHRNPMGKCLKFYPAGGDCTVSGHGNVPLPHEVLYELSAGKCPQDHSTPKTCTAQLTKVGKAQKAAKDDIDVPGSALKDYFETKGHLTIYDPLAIPPAKVV